MNAYNPNDRSTWRNDSSGTWHLPGVSIPFESYEQARAYRNARPDLAGRTIFPKVYNWSDLLAELDRFSRTDTVVAVIGR